MTRSVAVMDHRQSVTPITSPVMFQIVILNELQHPSSCHTSALIGSICAPHAYQRSQISLLSPNKYSLHLITVSNVHSIHVFLLHPIQFSNMLSVELKDCAGILYMVVF